jgi:tetratricopeptide (TPR) repeat protein
MDEIKILDVVAMREDIPEHGLRRGEVGTVVERWKDGALEVEFSDDTGEAYAFVALDEVQLIKLHFNKAEHSKLSQLDGEARDLLDRAFTFLNEGDEVEAEKFFRLAIEMNPTSKAVLLNSILTSHGDNKNWETVIPSLRFLFRLAPDYERGRNNLAIAYLNSGVERAKAGDVEIAQMFFNYAIGVSATPDVDLKVRENFAGVLTSLGIQAHASGDFEKAMVFMRIACMTSPSKKTRHNLGLAHAFLAWWHMGENKYEEAIPVFEAAEETGLILPELLNDYGIALIFSGRMSEAELAFERALKLAPDNRTIKENLTKLLRKESFETYVPEEIKAEYMYIPTMIQEYQLAA